MSSLLQYLAFTYAAWFGAYLLNRNPGKSGIWFAALGLLSYAFGMGIDFVAEPGSVDEFRYTFVLLPSVFWLYAIVNLPIGLQEHSTRISRFELFLPAGVVVIAAAPLLIDGMPLVLRYVVLALPIYTLVKAIGNLSDNAPKKWRGTLIAAMIFFALAVSLLVVPQTWLNDELVLIAIVFDLGLLGIVIAAFDAFDEGEVFLPDFFRSLAMSASATLIIGVQIVAAMMIEDTNTPTLRLLLLGATITIICLIVFSRSLNSLFDRVTLSAETNKQAELTDLRSTAVAIPRQNTSLTLSQLDERDFIKLTRRALSSMRDLSRLAASPLIRLPFIDDMIALDNTLERASALKQTLTDSIERLKPRHKGDFGTSDEWRHYNALYFPYVAGLKPYSRRALHDNLSETEQEALEWLRTYVPERTLHNWQNAAAALVAADLREKQASAV